MDEPPLLVYPTLAVALGINTAIVFQQLHFLLNGQKTAKNHYNFIDERWWVYNSYPEWRAQYFPWLSVSTLKGIFLDLENDALVISRQGVKRPSDRRKWYTIDYEAWDKKCLTIGQKVSDGASDKKCPIIGQKMSNDSSETSTETSTENTKREVFDKVIRYTLQFKEGTHYGILRKYINFLTGQTPAKNRKGQENGEWHEYQLSPGMDAAEMEAFGYWLRLEEVKPLRKPTALNDYAARFRSDPQHDIYVARYRVPVPAAAAPAEPDDDIIEDPERAAALIAQMMQATKG
jgi:hypothetical protein